MAAFAVLLLVANQSPAQTEGSYFLGTRWEDGPKKAIVAHPLVFGNGKADWSIMAGGIEFAPICPDVGEHLEWPGEMNPRTTNFDSLLPNSPAGTALQRFELALNIWEKGSAGAWKKLMLAADGGGKIGDQNANSEVGDIRAAVLRYEPLITTIDQLAHAFDPDTLALDWRARFPYNAHDASIGGDCHFRPHTNIDPKGVFWVDDPNAVQGEFDLLTVMIHEAGHALGLGHNEIDPASVMYPAYSEPKRQLSLTDIINIQILYNPYRPATIWSQVPGYRYHVESTNQFGGDRPSSFDWRLPVNTNVIADDFISDGRAIVAIRWWGSYASNYNQGFEDGFVLSFFSDDRTETNYSKPDSFRATYIAPAAAVKVTDTQRQGLDQRQIYQYEVFLADTLVVVGPFAPKPDDPNIFVAYRRNAFLTTSNTVYWLSISAEVGTVFTPEKNAGGVITNWVVADEAAKPQTTNQFWGWHTSPIQQEDISTFGRIQEPGQQLVYSDWKTNSVFHGEIDQAFELITPATPINTNIFAHTKWLQRPDYSTNGMDVLATEGSAVPIVADDFRCKRTGPITGIHIWASWLNDRFDSNAVIKLRLWSDVPATNSQPSHPGVELWSRSFTNGVNYNWQVAASDIFYERFLDPSDTNFVGKDTKVYQYNFQIATNQAFNQTNNAIYWLSVTASGTTNRFGWKTCITNDHFMDDAAFATVPTPNTNQWTDLHYPAGHPFAPRTADMAFALETPPPAAPVGQASLTIQRSGASVTVRWNNPAFRPQSAAVLPSAGNPDPWVDIEGTSPLVLTASNAKQFYRVIYP
jgi:matrixin